MTNLPAHLQNRPYGQSRMQDAAAGVGSMLPAHISIGSGSFTLIDASGAQNTVDTKYLDVCIIDRSDVMCKMYFGKKWTPGSTDPPLCFSMNGVAPSKDAIEPQARTCGECEKNERGSAVSDLTGKEIKACRDEIKVAVIPDGYDMVFQMTISPGHFKNWKAYGEKFKGQQFAMEDLWTRLTFEQGKSGVLVFAPRPQVKGGPAVWIDAETTEIRNEALVSKKTDLIVGRLDQPRAALPPPNPDNRLYRQAEHAEQRQISTNPENRQDHQGEFVSDPTTGPARDAGRTSTRQMATAQTTTRQGTAEAASEPARRTRRTKAQIESDNAAAKGNNPAPFRPEPQPNGGAPFGMAEGMAPDAELEQTLDSVFGS